MYTHSGYIHHFHRVNTILRSIGLSNLKCKDKKLEYIYTEILLIILSKEKYRRDSSKHPVCEFADNVV